LPKIPVGLGSNLNGGLISAHSFREKQMPEMGVDSFFLKSVETAQNCPLHLQKGSPLSPSFLERTMENIFDDRVNSLLSQIPVGLGSNLNGGLISACSFPEEQMPETEVDSPFSKSVETAQNRLLHLENGSPLSPSFLGQTMENIFDEGLNSLLSQIPVGLGSNLNSRRISEHSFLEKQIPRNLNLGVDSPLLKSDAESVSKCPVYPHESSLSSPLFSELIMESTFDEVNSRSPKIPVATQTDNSPESSLLFSLEHILRNNHDGGNSLSPKIPFTPQIDLIYRPNSSPIFSSLEQILENLNEGVNSPSLSIPVATQTDIIHGPLFSLEEIVGNFNEGVNSPLPKPSPDSLPMLSQENTLDNINPKTSHEPVDNSQSTAGNITEAGLTLTQKLQAYVEKENPTRKDAFEFGKLISQSGESLPHIASLLGCSTAIVKSRFQYFNTVQQLHHQLNSQSAPLPFPPITFCDKIPAQYATQIFQYGVDINFDFLQAKITHFENLVSQWRILKPIHKVVSLSVQKPDQTPAPSTSQVCETTVEEIPKMDSNQKKMRTLEKKIGDYAVKRTNNPKHPNQNIVPEQIKETFTITAFVLAGFTYRNRLPLKKSPSSWFKHFLLDHTAFPQYVVDCTKKFEYETLRNTGMIVDLLSFPVTKFIQNDGFLINMPNSTCSLIAGNKGLYCILFKNILPPDFQQYMMEKTSQFVSSQSAAMTFQKGRGEGSYYCFGYHHNQQPVVIPYAASHSETYLSWINEMTPYFTTLKYLVEKNFPELLTFENNLLQANPLSPFTSGQLNWETCVGKHIDSRDYPRSLSCVTTIGKYTGGELFLHDFGVKVPVQPGDIVFLESATVTHSVLPVLSGNRTSITLYLNKQTVLSKK
jgi:hypothetical protein